MSYVRAGLGAGEVNPLNQQPLLPGQVLVTGPANTGPRVTVVLLTGPWPHWITDDGDGYPEDTGAIPGGTWSGPQQLPELISTGNPSLWLLVAVVVGYLLFFGKRQSPGTWE